MYAYKVQNQEKMSLNTTLSQIDEAIEQLKATVSEAPGHMFVKDMNNNFIFGNKNIIAHSGNSSPGDLIGKNDKQLPWHKCAEHNFSNNKSVLYLNKTLQFEDYVPIEDGTDKGSIVKIYKEKKPFIHNGIVIGVWGVGIRASKIQGEQVFDYLNTQNDRILILTKKQRQCLEKLIEGNSVRETATELELSVRTVESHLLTLRKKNNISCLRTLLQFIKPIT